MNRLVRIAHQITAILQPEEMSEGPQRETWFRDRPYSKTLTFETSDGILYKVFFHYQSGHSGRPPGTWEIIFEQAPFNGPRSKKNFEVIQKVAEKIRDFLAVESPKYIVGSPTSVSRAKLYKTMFQRFIPEAQMVSQKHGEILWKMPQVEGGE